MTKACLCIDVLVYNRAHTLINHSSLFHKHCLLLSPSLSPSPPLLLCRSQSILYLIPRLQSSASILLQQLMLSPLTTWFAQKQESYLQIQKMPLFVSITRVLPKGFFLLRNRLITRGDTGKSTIPATIRRPRTGGRHP
jgi:hypothetical protein